ncbi:S8 family serine peptidase [Natrinema caseinilyticum]|uniref:S8 family serine peptidase n=1 Tax=Natrinema caseinilyticum TaxID=2961570 RepID=UPI0020C1C569|nr:S8 family serine peptidase [Natrinema caseinilyticum]
MSDDNKHLVNRRRVLEAASSLGALIGFGGVVSATPGREPGPKKDEVLVGVSSSVTDVESTVERTIPDTATIVHSNDVLGYAAVTFSESDSTRSVSSFGADIVDGDGIEYAENNATYHPFDPGTDGAPEKRDDVGPAFAPNDPEYGSQYAPQMVNCEEAWDVTLGDPDVTIAVLDQGIQYDHPHLAENMDDNASNYGRDFAGGDGDPYPTSQSESHGTHVAGIAAGGTDDGTGPAGISNCSILSGRVLGSEGGSIADIADAVQWATEQGADVINMSLGGGNSSQLMRDACSYAYSQGTLVVAAAGNESSDVSYPASYDDVLAVSSVDEDGSLSNFSNYGPEIELAAPGGDVLSSVPWDSYNSFSGTSMASPVVAGVAGLTLSAHPNLSPDALRSHLQNTAVDVGLDETEQGHGRVDAGNAVTTAPGDSPDNPDTPGPGACGDETATAHSDGRLYSGYGSRYASDAYTYQLDTNDPCQATTTLDGVSYGDFDLYLTTDGRTPTTRDYDEASTGPSAAEEISVDLSGDETLGILVHAASGQGTYTLSVEELGR